MRASTVPETFHQPTDLPGLFALYNQGWDILMAAHGHQFNSDNWNYDACQILLDAAFRVVDLSVSLKNAAGIGVAA